MSNLMLMTLFGGIMLLLYGVNLAGKGLREAAGPHIKTALQTLTRNRFAALLTGLVVTFLMQSSSATSVLLVGLADSGLLGLGQSIGVILGANIGTTITVQLVAFRIYDYAVFISGIGLLLMFIGGNQRRKSIGEGILGFGLVFLSIGLMSEATAPLQESALFREIMVGVKNSPLLGILLSGAFTALIQSSAATISIALSLSLHHLIPLEAALPIILGANIGTCATALLGSMRANVTARRVARAHFLFNAIGVLIAWPLLGPFARVIELSAEEVPRQIANAHTLFNVVVALLFVPFISAFSRMVERWVPEAKEEPEAFAPKYLNPQLLSEPDLALGQATRETMRMAEIVQDMLRLSLKAIISAEGPLIERIESMDDQVDTLDRALRFYLIKLGPAKMSVDEAARQAEILSAISNLEHIGDVIDKNLMELAKKKLRKGVQFSHQGRQEIEKLHAMVISNFELAVSAFATRNPDLAQKVIREKARLNDYENEFCQTHLKRLENGLAESFETSSIHLDVLSNLKRINSYVTNICYPIAARQRMGE